MQRRTYLGALAGGGLAVGGFVVARTSRDSSASSGETPTNTPPDDAPSAAKRWVTIGDVGPVPNESPVTFDIEIDDPWITPDSTATFTITTTNRSDEERSVSPALVKGTSADGSEDGLVVYSHRARDFEIEAYEPPCFDDEDAAEFVRTSEFDGEEQVVFTMEGHSSDSIGAGESRTEQLIVADDPTVEDCFPPATYRFETLYSFDETGESWPWELVVKRLD